MTTTTTTLMIKILISISICYIVDGMIDEYNHLKIGYEVRSIHQFKFDVGGKLEMTGFIVNNIDDDNINNNNETEIDTEKLNIYHCTDREIENLNKYNSMSKLCENINNFQCSYNFEINEDNKNEEIFYSFNSLKKQWMTMIIISCSKNKIYDISSLKITSSSSTNSKMDKLNIYH